MRALTEYNRKRKFQETSEPVGRIGAQNNPIFVVQRHAATRLHFDFRLQVNGALASWAVPKGPPEERGEKRLAIHVEDHPIEYAKFEGDIPKGNYGAGHVDIWDKGTYEIEGAESASSQIEKGDLKFTLKGERLNGRYALVKMRNAPRGNEWLFIRKTDASAARDEVGGRRPQPKRQNEATVASKAAGPATLEGSKKAPFPSQVPVALAHARDCRIEAPSAVKLHPAISRTPGTRKSTHAVAVAGKNANGDHAPSDPATLEKELLHGETDSLNVELDGKALSLTHLNKLYFTEPELRKRDVLAYYLRIAPYILPFLKDRPLVLKRYPNGIDGKFFFQKEAPASRPGWVKTAMIYSDERKAKMPYVLASDRADLQYLTNLGCIDHNPWSSRFDDETHPDYVFFDLDPTGDTPFEVVLTVAKAVYKHLEKIGVRSYLKTSGASGFHIYVPLERKYTYEQVRLFAGAMGQRVKSDLPEVVTFERKVSSRRKGTVLFDAVQNARGKPLAAPYSLRPFRGAPVSTPVSAKELDAKLRPENLNIETIFERLKRSGDLWKDFWKHRQRLEDTID